jgi:hypothetical protein
MFQGKQDRKKGDRGELERPAKRRKTDTKASTQNTPDINTGRVAAIGDPERHSASILQDTSESSSKTWSKKGELLSRLEITDPALALQHKLTTEEGQLEENPNFTREQARQAAKREYNRRNAARGRIRRKCLLSELQDKCDMMETEMEALKIENAALKAEIEDMKHVAATENREESVGRSIQSASHSQQAIGQAPQRTDLDGSESLQHSNAILSQHDPRLYSQHSGTDVNARLMNNSAILSHREQGLYLPHVSDTALLFQQQRALVPQSRMGGIIHHNQPIPSHAGLPGGQDLLQTLMLARVRAALNSSTDPSQLSGVNHQGSLRGYPPNFLPK